METEKKNARVESRGRISMFASIVCGLIATISSIDYVYVLAQPAGPGPGGGGIGGGVCVNPTITIFPSAADLRQDNGCTILAGVEDYGEVSLTYPPIGNAVPTNAHIYNSFEAGFSSSQDSIISGWGCSTPSDLYDSAGGLDLGLAESKVRKLCYNSIANSFPNKQSDNSYRGAVGPCGGHTNDYHFHARYHCLYSLNAVHTPRLLATLDRIRCTVNGRISMNKNYRCWTRAARISVQRP